MECRYNCDICVFVCISEIYLILLPEWSYDLSFVAFMYLMGNTCESMLMLSLFSINIYHFHLSHEVLLPAVYIAKFSTESRVTYETARCILATYSHLDYVITNDCKENM